ncbi:MAG: 50S ribosomal protein L21 [Spirochaetales bacterium]|nr:50S ribosomal protein L21 [Spirochaetales bacterium]
MYALVEIKGKQYRAEKGATIEVDSFCEEVGTKVELDSVLLLNDDKSVKVGAPFVAGAKVVATIEKNIKDKKVIGVKFKRRKRYERRFGHRQQYTVLKIEDVIGA